MKSRLHSDNSRVGKWLYTRIWNSREDEQFESTVDLIRQMSGFFKLSLSHFQVERLKREIGQIRNTVYKRFKRHQRIRNVLSKTWRTDVRLVKRWDLGGLINIQDHHALKKLAVLFNDRDYVGPVVPDEIPIDMKISICG